VKQVWKFDIRRVSDYNMIKMPMGAKILHVGMQNDEIFIWALVHPTNEYINRKIGMVGTGHSIPKKESENYIGSVINHMGEFVWHFFDLGEE